MAEFKRYKPLERTSALTCKVSKDYAFCIMARFFDPCNDIAFKKMFNEHPDRTISFLNAVLRLEGDRRIRSLEFLPQEQLPFISESKFSVLDVRCTDQRNFQYIVEVQNKLMVPYLHRVQYYASHAYTGQMKKSQKYDALKPVTMLSILNHTLFPEDVPYLSYHQNVEVETGQSYLKDLSYAFIELPKFHLTQEQVKTAEEQWIFMMKEATHCDTAPQDLPSEIKEAWNVLEEHAWSDEEREAYFKMKLAMMDEEATIDTAREEGEIIGMEKGVKLAAKAGLSAEIIAQELGISLEKVREILV